VEESESVQQSFDAATTSEVPAEAAAKPSMAGRSVTTFVFISDPQPNIAQGRNNANERLVILSHLNDALNALDSNSVRWPDGFALTCDTERITPIDAIFIGGDLGQTGGDYNAMDQVIRTPLDYQGGWELQATRHLFQWGFQSDTDIRATRTKYPRTYFGLGNHDIQTDYHPIVPWYPNRPVYELHSPVDYWRDQMWNFICQMHAGVRVTGYAAPAYPVTAIDADGDGGYDWGAHSFNYMVDLGPVDVYQMHRYGGDTDDGRSDGMDWLRGRLMRGGPNRPVIIVQHYGFVTLDGHPIWTEKQRDAFLDVLAPYNVIALLTGHTHDPSEFDQPVPVRGRVNPFREFRPGGACDRGVFAAVRVSRTTLDVLFGNGISGSATWTSGGEFPLSPFLGWERILGKERFTSPPAVYVASDGSQDAYAVGHDRKLYHNAWNSGTAKWQPDWDAICVDTVVGRPCVVSVADGTQDVFVVGTDGLLRHLFTDHQHGWVMDILDGGPLHPGVNAVVGPRGQINVFGWGLDGRLWHTQGSGGGWNPLAPQAEVILSAPSVSNLGFSEKMHMVALDANNKLIYQIYDANVGVWTGWLPVGEQFSSPPTVLVSSTEQVDVFARGPNLDLRHRFRHNSHWGGQSSSLGGRLASGAHVLMDYAAPRIEVLASDLDRSAGRVYWAGGWGTVTGLGGLCTEPPIVAGHQNGDKYAFAPGHDGMIYRLLLPA
jgi:cytolysin (calcineurin-like family phosphatase)